MSGLVDELIRLGTRGTKANCFNAVQLYFGDSGHPSICGPEEFVFYIQSKFYQLSLDKFPESGRSAILLPMVAMRFCN